MTGLLRELERIAERLESADDHATAARTAAADLRALVEYEHRAGEPERAWRRRFDAARRAKWRRMGRCDWCGRKALPKRRLCQRHHASHERSRVRSEIKYANGRGS